MLKIFDKVCKKLAKKNESKSFDTLEFNYPEYEILDIVIGYTGYQGIDYKVSLTTGESFKLTRTINTFRRQEGLPDFVRYGGLPIYYNNCATKGNSSIMSEDMLKNLKKKGITINGVAYSGDVIYKVEVTDVTRIYNEQEVIYCYRVIRGTKVDEKFLPKRY